MDSSVSQSVKKGLNIICLLSVRPCVKTYEFFKHIQLTTDYEVIIVIDDNKYTIPEYDRVVEVVQIHNTVCALSGYKNSVLWCKKRACSRDKALHYFNKKYKKPYQQIWFVEDDVFIPAISTIQEIDQKYGNSDDLLLESNTLYDDDKEWGHWTQIWKDCKIQPYSRSMICAVRCSKRMLDAIHKYVTQHGSLFMDEALFTTIAFHNGLKMKVIPELQHIAFRHDWLISDIKKEYLYHPIKDIDVQYEYRKALQL